MTLLEWLTGLPSNERDVVQVAMALPCADVHPEGAECILCNPVTVAGYSQSPGYAKERLAIARQRVNVAVC